MAMATALPDHTFWLISVYPASKSGFQGLLLFIIYINNLQYLEKLAELS